MRIGMGYDVHRLVEDRELIIGGVNITYEKGLLGHSDADVLLHAISDAIIGALGKGDIGEFYPDTDEKYKGVSSLLLLEDIASKMGEYKIANVDSVIIAERPKMAPFIEEMRANIAKVLACDISRINVKATTEEKLGFTGSGEGISAHAVVLLESK